MLELQKKFPDHCYATIGLHPCDVKENFQSVLDDFQSQIENPVFVAIGECGTDAYWDLTYWEEQKTAFSIQMEWAKSTGKPIIIHSRNSLEENIKLVRSAQDGRLTGVFHCFGGNEEEARQIIDLGFYLGIGGTISYKKNQAIDALPKIPIESIVLETDSPFLTPVPHRGKRNEPAFIPHIADHLTKILDRSFEEIANSTTSNAFNLFKLIR